MTDEQQRTEMSLMGDEDGEWAFVQVDDTAPTAEGVEVAWREAVKRQWGIEYEEFEEGPDITRSWYKPLPDGEGLIACLADDPDRDSEWWSFELPDEVSRDA